MKMEYDEKKNEMMFRPETEEEKANVAAFYSKPLPSAVVFCPPYHEAEGLEEREGEKHFDGLIVPAAPGPSANELFGKEQS